MKYEHEKEKKRITEEEKFKDKFTYPFLLTTMREVCWYSNNKKVFETFTEPRNILPLHLSLSCRRRTNEFAKKCISRIDNDVGKFLDRFVAMLEYLLISKQYLFETPQLLVMMHKKIIEIDASAERLGYDKKYRRKVQQIRKISKKIFIGIEVI